MAPNFQNDHGRERGTNSLVMLLAIAGIVGIFMLGMEIGVRLYTAGMMPIF